MESFFFILLLIHYNNLYEKILKYNIKESTIYKIFQLSYEEDFQISYQYCQKVFHNSFFHFFFNIIEVLIVHIIIKKFVLVTFMIHINILLYIFSLKNFYFTIKQENIFTFYILTLIFVTNSA